MLICLTLNNILTYAFTLERSRTPDCVSDMVETGLDHLLGHSTQLLICRQLCILSQCLITCLNMRYMNVLDEYVTGHKPVSVQQVLHRKIYNQMLAVVHGSSHCSCMSALTSPNLSSEEVSHAYHMLMVGFVCSTSMWLNVCDSCTETLRYTLLQAVARLPCWCNVACCLTSVTLFTSLQYNPYL